jgi:hypothetical protein
MKILSWNCQGIGNPKTARALFKLIATNSPDLIFLMESKLLCTNNVFLSRINCNYKVHQVECSTAGGGRAGGLLMLWDPCTVDCSIINANLNYIDVHSNHNNILWRATGLYGYPQTQNKLLTCKLIEELAGDSQNPNWLLFGDFNIILNNEEKLGGNAIDQNIISTFRDTINVCNLQDLGYNGEIFTWINRQDDQRHTKARLDRFFASEGWIHSFPHHKNSHLVRYSSDHCPLLLEFSPNPPCRKKQNQKKIHKYEIIWTQHEDHISTVKRAWQQTNGSLTRKLASTLHYMNTWGQHQFGSIPQKIKEAQAELHVLNNNSDLADMMVQIQNKENELDKLLEKEEMWWSQRSRVQWLQHGDKNTKFFHQKASQRRQRNRIDAIQDEQGTTHHNIEGIENTLTNYFKSLFTSQSTHNMEQAVKVVKNKITPDMQDFLNTTYTVEEVTEAIKHMKGMAAPGPDGLPAVFYHNYWDIIGEDVIKAVLEVLNDEGDPSPYNKTHICLIPKKKYPIYPGDYRPISLCNTIYKIISKTISNRLKNILPNVISHNQSVFLQDRLITDNTLVAFEMFHYFKQTTRQKGYVGIKTDMAKAYDRVE